MNPKEPSDAPLEEGPNPPRINLLAMISFFIGIGIPIVLTAYEETVTVILTYHLLGRPGELLFIAIFATATVGVICGHCACTQIRMRRPHQKGKAMAVFGLIGCYVYIIVVVFLILTVVLVL